MQREPGNRTEENRCKVKIGSISVTLRNSLAQKQDAHPSKATDAMLKNGNSESQLNLMAFSLA